MFTVASLAYSSTAARLRNLQPRLPVAGAQVRGAATHRLLAVGFGRLDQTVKLSASHRAFGRVAEQPAVQPESSARAKAPTINFMQVTPVERRYHVTGLRLYESLSNASSTPHSSVKPYPRTPGER